MARYRRRFRRFRRWGRRTYRRARSIGAGMVARIAQTAVRNSKRASYNYQKRKQKKTMKNILLILIVAAAGFCAWFFRDKLKAILKIG